MNKEQPYTFGGLMDFLCNICVLVFVVVTVLTSWGNHSVLEYSLIVRIATLIGCLLVLAKILVSNFGMSFMWGEEE